MRSDVWTRDELILALDLYFRIQFRKASGSSSENYNDILAVSVVLKQIAQLISSRIGKTRSIASLRMKLANFQSLDPAHIKKGRKGLPKGGAADIEVWRLFSSNLLGLEAAAEGIMWALGTSEIEKAKDDPETVEAPEGRLLTRLHRIRERNPKLVAQKKRVIVQSGARVCCEACGFDYFGVYGERGRDYIEVHHILPLSALAGQKRTKLSDLALLCANCHRMVHARRDWLTMDQLKQIIVAQR
jgi:5-methylcytosine-specific restriction protein A